MIEQQRPRITHTHTIATLAISRAAYDEIARLLRDADYHHVFDPDGTIDMTGIGLVMASIEIAPVASNTILSDTAPDVFATQDAIRENAVSSGVADSILVIPATSEHPAIYRDGDRLVNRERAILAPVVISRGD